MYIIDLIALTRTLKEKSWIFEESSFKIISSIPFGQKRVDIVADSYQPNSVKICELQTGGFSSTIHIKSSKSRVIWNFAYFLSNGENEKKMVKIIFSTPREKNEGFELLEYQPAYHLKTKSL